MRNGLLNFQFFLRWFQVLMLVFSLTSCGKKTKNDANRNIAEVSNLLNKKDYDRAIEILENLLKGDPQNRELLDKLADAYAGKSGFELLTFVSKVENVKKMEKGKDITDILENFSSMLKSIASLSSEQMDALNKAINVYKTLGLTPEIASEEENLKWGILYTYRLLAYLNNLVAFINNLVKNPNSYNNDEIQQVIISNGEAVANDLFNVFLLFRKSFGKIKGLAEKIIDALESALSNEVVNIKLDKETKATNYKEWLIEVFYYNKSEFAKALNLLIFKVAEKFNITVDEGKERIEYASIILKKIIDIFEDQGGQNLVEIRKFVDQEIIFKGTEAIKASIEARSLNPIKQLVESNNEKIKSLVKVWTYSLSKTLEGIETPELNLDEINLLKAFDLEQIVDQVVEEGPEVFTGKSDAIDEMKVLKEISETQDEGEVETSEKEEYSEDKE